MTKHIMTNGIANNGTTGTVATTAVKMSSVVAAHEVRLEVRSECEHRSESHSADAYCDVANDTALDDSGKRLLDLQPVSMQCSLKQNDIAKPQGEVFRNAGNLPAAAWASLAIIRNGSYGSVSI